MAPFATGIAGLALGANAIHATQTPDYAWIIVPVCGALGFLARGRFRDVLLYTFCVVVMLTLIRLTFRA